METISKKEVERIGTEEALAQLLRKHKHAVLVPYDETPICPKCGGMAGNEITVVVRDVCTKPSLSQCPLHYWVDTRDDVKVERENDGDYSLYVDDSWPIDKEHLLVRCDCGHNWYMNCKPKGEK